MDKLNKNEEPLISMEQLVPKPDVYNIRRQMKALPEQEKVGELLHSINPGCLFVTLGEKQNVTPSQDALASGCCHKGYGLFTIAQLPNVRIELYFDVGSSKRRLSFNDENLLVSFLDNLGYREVELSSENDRVERRLFSL